MCDWITFTRELEGQLLEAILAHNSSSLNRMVSEDFSELLVLSIPEHFAVLQAWLKCFRESLHNLTVELT